MKKIHVEDAAKAIQGKLIHQSDSQYFTEVVHDSRKCSPETLFVCIRGQNQDGHQFIPQAVEAGCRSVLVSDDSQVSDEMDINVILVKDTVKAMGDLAAWYLARLDILRIAVTGSVGKTSTRDMVCSVLNERMKCRKNLKNYNNDIGLPLSIFQLEDDDEAVVLEMGMSGPGEIRRLTQIVRPQIGIITNIGTAHMEKLGSREGIFEAKMEITDYLLPKMEGGCMFFVRDEEFLRPDRTEGDYRQHYIGDDGKSDYIVTDINDDGIDGVRFALEHNEERRAYHVPAPGRHNAFNASIAIAVGEHLGLSAEEIQAGLDKVELTGHRLRILRNDRITVIDDTYNASPDSMKAALKVLEKSPCPGKKTAVLGEMYELGEQEKRMHYDVGVFAAGCRIDLLVGIGPLAENIVQGAGTGALKTMYYKDKDSFLADADNLLERGDIVLVKGSRGMKMEAVVEGLIPGKGQE